MSRLRDEIQSCMRELTAGDPGGFSAQFVFPREFVGFQGHFPDRPILPGVCLIQAVLVMCQSALPGLGRLDEVVLAKFLAPVTDGQELKVECRESPAGEGATRVKAGIRRGDESVARIELLLSRARDGETG